MTLYGILITNTDWTNHNAVEIEKAAFIHHGDKLIAGTQALIYLREPVDAVVASAEITGSVIAVDDAPDADLNTPRPSAAPESELNEIHSKSDPTSRESPPTTALSHYVPLRLTRLKGQTPAIPLSQLQKTLGNDFSVFDETWIPLSRQQYEAITAHWEAMAAP